MATRLPYVRIPDYDHVYSGKLRFQIEGYDPGLRHSWNDGKRQTLENLLDDIVSGGMIILAARQTRREEYRERERQWQERQRREREAAEQVAREQERLEYLSGLLSRHSEITELAGWLEKMVDPSHALPAKVQELVAWAQSRLERLEQSIVPAQIDAELIERGLFPDGMG